MPQATPEADIITAIIQLVNQMVRKVRQLHEHYTATRSKLELSPKTVHEVTSKNGNH